MAKPIQITVGGSGLYDPANGATQVSIPILAGIEFYIEKKDVGTLEYDQWESLSAGGFKLLSGSFATGEVFTIHQTGILVATTSGSYTNGYNFTKVINALFGRLGWQQPPAAGSPVVNSTNLVSRSGRYFNDGSFHSLVSVDNIKATIEEAGASDANLNTKLTALQQAAIMRCLSNLFTAPEIIEQVKNFERYGYNDQLISNSGLFAGVEINVAQTPDAAIQIDAVTCYFDADKTFDLYLFKDGKITPEWTEEITVVANELTEITLTDRILNAGKYFFGYFQNDLGSAKAIQEQVKCWPKTKLFGIRSFTAANTSGVEFDRNNRSYPVLPIGLNLQISSFRDYTNSIVRKASMFDEVLGLQMAYMTVEQIVYAVRSNTNERILKEQLDKVGMQLDLNGAAPITEGPKVQGLKQRITQELDKVRKQFYPEAKPQIVNLEECWS